MKLKISIKLLACPTLHIYIRKGRCEKGSLDKHTLATFLSVHILRGDTINLNFILRRTA
jgi:hypothetical protein